MKNPIHGLAIGLLALGAASAGAQTAPSSGAQQRAVLPAQRATPAAPAATRPAATAVQPRQFAAAAKATLPANLFSVEDRAIIIVGGKPMAAGDVKRQVQSELRQQSVPARAIVKRVPQGAPVRGGGVWNGPITGNARPLVERSDRADAIRPVERIAGMGRSDTARASSGLSYTEMINYCKTHPAEITRVRGTVTPNARFTIEGSCFGDTTGAVEAIGQFPGGNLRLVFEGWSDSQIIAFVPAVSGAPDHVIALTVVRPDRGRSPAMQARFVATRLQVPVPARYWSPRSDFVAIEVDQGGGNIFSGYTVWGAGATSRSTPFSLLINPACELDSAAWSSSTGHIEAFNGWDSPGPPNLANVEVAWTPRCVTQTTNYVFASSSQRICSVEFSLAAWANCPLGLAP